MAKKAAAKKTAAKKTAAPRTAVSTAGQMDPDPTPTSGPTGARERNARSLDVLIKEVTDLFPETPYEVGKPGQWNVRTSVVFETGGVEGLVDLLVLLAADERVEEITEDSREGLLEVALYPSLRSMDSRESFGLAETWSVLTDNEPGSEPGSETWPKVQPDAEDGS